MKKYRVNVNGTAYEVEIEELTGAAFRHLFRQEVNHPVRFIQERFDHTVPPSHRRTSGSRFSASFRPI